MLIAIVPTNPIQAMANSNTLQVVVFAFFIGISFMLVGDKAREARGVVPCAHLMFKTIELIINSKKSGLNYSQIIIKQQEYSE